jgi:alkanesulfonate monooxygenase SsuD/methylene tetrahydromethanopterin reductase-like flavin-dependent oxidoreductase (luciferase family)
MKLGLGVAAGADPEQLVRLAADAETLGYASMWSNDTPSGDGLLQLSRWAATSKSIELGVGVLALDRHKPAEIAARVAMLGLPETRTVVGVGAGFDRNPLVTVRAGVESLRRLMPRVRLAVAAMGPQMCALAGEVADVALLNWMTPERAAWARELVLDGARRAGRDPIQVYGYIRVAVGPDAADRLAREARLYLQMGHYARNFEAMGVDPMSVGVAAADPAELPAALAQYSALDVALVRVPSERNVEAILGVARAAIAESRPAPATPNAPSLGAGK